MNANDKSIFNATMKEILDFDANNIIEELLSNLLKDQLNEDGLRVNTKQLQKVNKVDLLINKAYKPKKSNNSWIHF